MYMFSALLPINIMDWTFLLFGPIKNTRMVAAYKTHNLLCDITANTAVITVYTAVITAKVESRAVRGKSFVYL